MKGSVHVTEDKKNNLDKMIKIANDKNCKTMKTKLRFTSDSKVMSDRKALAGRRALNENFI
ncbi:hypothetical protein [Abyssisolibacter fermentans]|uniref:hypothetical protein n=1 Tax=Abyssisolibacter fermentans TaxID=1766203 RepID=UPI00138EEE31|nr:hypothetical protein [Abyssisolibacter fermentans]